MQQDEPLLRVRGLRVTLPTPAGALHAVRGLDFDVNRGEIVCLVGESGCGKSMTSLALMGLAPRRARVEADELRFAGHDLPRLSERQRAELRGNRMAMIFQEPMTSLNPSLTIGRQLCEVWYRHRSRDRRAAEARAAELLGLVGISSPEHRLRQYPHQLSGGLRQRVMIAMALMCEPDLVIADEPTTALDVTIQAQILRLLLELRDRLGLAILLVTHDLGVVARMADRVVTMYAGEVVELAPAAALFTAPAHPYTRGLLACLPRPGHTPRGEPLGTIAGTVPGLIDPPEGCAFAPRCEDAHAACRRGDIPLHPLPAGRHVRCVLAVPAATGLETLP